MAEITAPDEWTDADRAHVTRLFPEAELVAPTVYAYAATGTLTTIADLSPAQDDGDGEMAEPQNAADNQAVVP